MHMPRGWSYGTAQAAPRPAARAALAVAMVVVAGCLAGCLELKDDLTINADGSGTVRIDVSAEQTAHTMYAFSMMSNSEAAGISYPPLTEEHARALFPGDDFEVKVEPKPRSGGMGLTVEAAFKDVNKLVASPYGQAHSLLLQRDGDKLTLKARTGVQAMAQAEEMSKAKSLGMGMMPIDPKVLTEAKDKIKVEFKITMPGAVAVANAVDGIAAEGNTIIWTADVSKQGTFEKTAASLDAVLSASCPAGEIQPSGETLRLDLVPFQDLKETQSVEAAPAVDEAKVLEAAKFVPTVLRVVRSFNLGGGEFYGENQAMLSGAIVLPREFAPLRWGEVTLDQVIDDKGRDLVIRSREERYRHRLSRMFGAQSEKPGDKVIHHVQLELKPPSFDVDKITTLKGHAEMFYPGVKYLVRIEKAVPKEVIVEMGDGERFHRTVSSSGGLELDHPKLKELGLTLKARETMRLGAVTMVGLAGSNETVVISQAQVFDAQGKPWPTIFTSQNMFGSGDSVAMIVPGAPEAPLSVALILEANGPKVTVPIALSDVPVAPAEPQKKTEDSASPSPAAEE